MCKQESKWRFAVDRGGTFTDIVALDPKGDFHTAKILSHSPDYEDASFEGIRRILGLERGDPLPEEQIAGIRFGTTLATNSLLERKGGRVALLITKGFGDLLEIGYQNRPDIFKLCISKPPPLYSAVLEIDERIDCHGRIVKRLDAYSLTAPIEALKNGKTETIAVVLMHAWRNPAHEILCERALKDHGFRDIVSSHRTTNLIKIVSRGQSTLVDAYLSTVLADYLGQIGKETGTIPVEFMQSNGSLTPPRFFTGKNALLSGPAGGVAAVGWTSKELGRKGIIGFDMGGTSTDVSRFEDKFEKVYERAVGGVMLQTEMLNIVTVAAGGGSTLKFDGRRMTVGPESAGSYPGPACYGFGGPLTLTDANLLTGRLIPDFFPKTFGPERTAPLDSAVVAKEFGQLTDEINAASGTSLTPREIAEGFLRIADERMATAIKEISVAKGFDVREYALLCFGGAGGQHACALASLLGIDTVVVHPLGSVMSAYGIGLAQRGRRIEQTVLLPYHKATHDELAPLFERMKERLLPHAAGEEKGDFEINCALDLRPRGADTFLTVEYASFDETIRTFEDQYQKLFGFIPEETDLEVVNLRIEIRESSEFFGSYRKQREVPADSAVPASSHEICHGGHLLQVPVYQREHLTPQPIRGPALIVDSNTTVVLGPEFQAALEGSGVVVMKRLSSLEIRNSHRSGRPDPVLLEVFHNLFAGVATEMGITLKNTAHSVNIKERLDFSCAVFDACGNLVANAPHIPVHLGAMADTVQSILKDNRASMRPGDVYLSNNPYRGGSHLPDMTVVCPVFSERDELLFFTASRGHHADVGGTTPGSMPPAACHVDEEGVLVDNLLIVRNGVFREDVLRQKLTEHPYPSRNVPERIADLRAQLAACHKGLNELMQAVRRYGIPLVSDYMHHIRENAEHSVKETLHRFLKDGARFHSAFEDFLDDGTPIRVAISIDGGPHPPETLKVVLDFGGTGPQHVRDNLNAPSSVTRSAVLYVLRCLIDADIPLNSGCLNPVEIAIPEGSLLNPLYPAPVASGNVETSQRIVDVLLGAFGIAAASQGTMNNLLFEVEGETPYYETIAGGAGAIEGCHGASGVQVHMTNTRITDPEVLEVRHPGIRLERFCLRKDSGGKGMFPGGEGVIREIKFLKPATVSILSERRVYAPYGINGGRPGSKGLNLRRNADGRTSVLGHREVLKVVEDEAIIIETPGGGGYGQG